MKDKNGNKRKLSFKYKCWLFVLPIFFIAFFLGLVFHFRIFDDYKTTKIIKINGSTNQDITFVSGKLELTIMVDGEEFIAYYQESVVSAKKVSLKVGDKIQYLAKDPSKIFPDRIKWIIILSCAEGIIVALFIGTTIYEIKKGM